MSEQAQGAQQSASLSKSGSWIGIAILALAVIGGAIIFFLQNYEHYRPVKGLTEITIGGGRFAVSGYEGLEHASWPQRLRGCFKLADPKGALAAGAPVENAAPYAAPSWFECWEPDALQQALEKGEAKAVVAERRDRGGYLQERIVAIYPSGRAFQWVRLRDKDQ